VSPEFQIIIALIAFIAGAITQWLSHRFTQSRESQKYYVEVYQKLYAPILTDIFRYIEMRTHFKRGWDTNTIEEQKIYDKILKHISDNLIYASPTLVASYHTMEVQSWESEAGFSPPMQFIPLVVTFINELEYVMNKAGMSSRYSNKENNTLIKYKILYSLWDILMRNGQEFESAIDILSVKFFFNESKMSERNYKSLRKYKDSKYSQEQVVHFCAKKLISTSEQRGHFISAIQPMVEPEYEDGGDLYYPHPTLDDALRKASYSKITSSEIFVFTYYNSKPPIFDGKRVKLIYDMDESYTVNDTPILQFNNTSPLVELICTDGSSYYISEDAFYRIFHG
jgi:hypothetical protein